MKRALSRDALRLVSLLGAAVFATTVLSNAASSAETITGPLAAKLTGKPPELSIGGSNAQEIKAKIRSGEIKLASLVKDVPSGVEASLDVEYGKGGEKGPDSATWKACGQECIDGVFYAFVSRNIYGKDSKDPLLRQLAINSSLIKSTDRGRTWARSASCRKSI